MSTAELEISILYMFEKLKIAPYFYCIEVSDDRDKWTELCNQFNRIKGISKILTLTSEETKNIWNFIELFLSIAPGIYKRPKSPQKIPLLMKLYLDRESELFDNINEYLDYNDSLDENTVLNFKKPFYVKEWFLFDDELLINNALDKTEAIEKFYRYSEAYDKITNGTIGTLESMKQEYNKKIQDIYKLIQSVPEPSLEKVSNKKAKHEDDETEDVEETADKKKHHSELSTELESIFLEQFKDVLKTIERENEKLYMVYTGLTHKKKRHQILKDAYKHYIISCYNSEREQQEKEMCKRTIESLKMEKEGVIKLNVEMRNTKDVEIQKLRRQTDDLAFLCSTLKEQLQVSKNEQAELLHKLENVQVQPVVIEPKTNFLDKFDKYVQRYPLIAKQMGQKDPTPRIAELNMLRKQIENNVEMVMESILEKHLKRMVG